MARPLSLSEDELLVRLRLVFKTGGYASASLARLSDESGLAKAALYHRFPDGKEGIALAVADSASEQFEAEVVTRLLEVGTPRARLESMVAALDLFYFGGRDSSLTDLFSMDGTPEPVRELTRASLMRWMDTLTQVLGYAGYTAGEARRKAEETVLRVEGALVISRALGDNGPFQRVLNGLVNDLIPLYA
jgi:AcrR family transcriptional regulator